MTEWEYQIVVVNPTWVSQSGNHVPDEVEIKEAYFNGMGEKGWELVGFLPPPPPKYEPKAGSYEFHAIFKRPKT